MVLSDYAVLLSWEAATLVVYAAAAVANRRGWGSVDYRPLATMVLLTGLLAQRASAPKLGESRGPEAGIAEAEAAVGCALGVELYVPLIVAVCVPCVVLVSCVVMVVMVKLVPPPLPPPPQSAPARRYSERRRA
ncbi:unnamed protein product [Urochloa decumbens]|uniref:Uncharacterized protein n=1 Tax=Urochloa decumbens TaxID=240449 RepID=A0ABC9BR78_9POAL